MKLWGDQLKKYFLSSNIDKVHTKKIHKKSPAGFLGFSCSYCYLHVRELQHHCSHLLHKYIGKAPKSTHAIQRKIQYRFFLAVAINIASTLHQSGFKYCYYDKKPCLVCQLIARIVFSENNKGDFFFNQHQLQSH